MKNSVIGVALVLAIVGGAAVANSATAERSKLPSPGSASVHAKRMDACPYYPSPVVCRDGWMARTKSEN
jgi:hypothetical protein